MDEAEKNSLSYNAQMAWDRYAKEHESKLDDLTDDQFFMLGDAFVDGYMQAIGDIYGI